MTESFQRRHTVMASHECISWWCLREQLRKSHKVTASDGVFERFYTNCKSLAQVTLRDLRASYKDIALSVLNDNPDMTSYGLLKHLQQLHQINTTDNAIRDFHRELKQGTLTLSEELAMNFDRLEDKGIRKTLQKHGWKGDVRQLCKKIFCLKEWMCEIKRLFSNTEPEPNTFALPLRELLDLCCSNDDFKFWSKLLCWKFCTKCGRRRPDAMNHLESVTSCNHTCRQCDQPPDFMEKDISFKTNVMGFVFVLFHLKSMSSAGSHHVSIKQTSPLLLRDTRRRSLAEVRPDYKILFSDSTRGNDSGRLCQSGTHVEVIS